MEKQQLEERIGVLEMELEKRSGDIKVNIRQKPLLVNRRSVALTFAGLSSWTHIKHILLVVKSTDYYFYHR